MSATMNIDWMRDVCDEELVSRPLFLKPFTTQIGGEDWTVATDGYIAVAIAGRFGFADYEGPTDKWEFFNPINAPTYKIDLASLRAMVGQRFVKHCERCACEAPKRYANIGLGRFNLELVAKALPHIDGENAEWQQRGAETPAHLRIGPWLIVWMPVRQTAETATPLTVQLSPTSPRVPPPSAPVASTTHEDTKRLDWIADEAARVVPIMADDDSDDAWSVRAYDEGRGVGTGGTLRAAIDQARTT